MDKRVNVQLPDHLMAKVKALAYIRDKAKTQIVIQAVRTYFEDERRNLSEKERERLRRQVVLDEEMKG